MTEQPGIHASTGPQWTPPPHVYPPGWESLTTDQRLAACADKATQLVGLTLAAAVDEATSSGYLVRLAKDDGHEFVLTMDFTLQRINVEVEGSTVVAASPG